MMKMVHQYSGFEVTSVARGKIRSFSCLDGVINQVQLLLPDAALLMPHWEFSGEPDPPPM